MVQSLAEIKAYVAELEEHKRKWQLQAACQTVAPEIMFSDDVSVIEQAKKVCRTCPVRVDCLEYAIVERPVVGVWGGFDEKQRKRIHKRLGTKRHIKAAVRQQVKELLPY